MTAETHFCYLLYAGTPIGPVRLTLEPLSAGWLHPLPSYTPLRLTLRVACAAIRGAGFRDEAPETGELVAAANAVKAQLGLMTEAGSFLQPISIDIWDDPAEPGPPFVLVHFREVPGSNSALLPPDAGGGGAAEDMPS